MISLGNIHVRTHKHAQVEERSNVESEGMRRSINSDHKHVLRSSESGIECATGRTVRIPRSQTVGVEVGTAGTRRAVAVAVAAEVGKHHIVDPDR